MNGIFFTSVKTIAVAGSLAASLLSSGCFSNELPPLTPEQDALIQAVRAPDPRVSIEQNLKAVNGDVNFQIPSNGQTPLSVSVIFREPEKMELLLQAGAKPDIQDKKGMTAIYYAAGLNDPFYLQRLIQAGGNVNIRELNEKTPLMEACRLGNLETAKVLLNVGADINAVDKRGRTVLMFAAGARTGSAAMVRFLKSKGVEHKVVDKAVQTPLTHAIDAGNTETAMLLLQTYPEDLSQDKLGKFGGLLAMNHAVKANNLVIAKELIRRKLPLNATISGTYKTLDKVNLENWMESFAKYGIIQNAQTPLAWAAMEDNLEMIELLLKAGANPCALDNLGNYPVDYTKKYITKKRLEKAMKQYEGR